MEDVAEGVRWLTAERGDYNDGGEGEGEGGRKVFARGWLVVVGHSVGATMGLKMLLEKGRGRGIGTARERIKAMVSLAGIADFVALREAHLDFKDAYDGFCTGAFGDEEEGKWELGRVFPKARQGVSLDGREEEEEEEEDDDDDAGLEVIVLGQSKADELVEWNQAEILRDGLLRRGWREEKNNNDDDEEYSHEKTNGGSNRENHVEENLNGGGMRSQKRRKRKRMAIVELEGAHDDVWEQGREIARCVGLVVEMVVGRG